MALWTPAEITTAVWLDADDYATFTLISGEVSVWADKSGNGRDATAGFTRPSYSATLWPGSKPTVVYPSEGPELFIAHAAALSATGGLSVFGAVRYAVSSNNNFWISKGVTDWIFYRNSGGSYQFAVNNSVGTLVGPTATHDTSAHIVGGIVDPSNKVWLSKDGTVTETAIGAVNGSTSGSVILGDVDLFSGFISEVIIIDGAVDESTRQKIEGYLAWKWGLEANLPTGHPYENEAPVDSLGVTVPVASFTLTAQTPTVTKRIAVSVPAASLTLTAQTPKYSPIVVSVPASSFTLTAQTPTTAQIKRPYIELVQPAPILSAVGDNYIGTVALGQPAPVLSAVGQFIIGQVALVMPVPIVTNTVGGTVVLAHPNPVLAAAGTVDPFATISLEQPSPVLNATGQVGAVASVALGMLSPTLNARSGGYAILEQLAPVLAAVGTTQGIGAGALILSSPVLTATGVVPGIGSVSLVMPAPVLAAGLGNHATLIVPTLVLAASGVVVDLASVFYAVNTETGAVTQFDGAEYSKLITARGKLYGLRGTTLYEMTGTDDDGADIYTTVRFAQQSFGTNYVKRMSEVYLTLRESDGVILEVVCDEQTHWRYQTDAGDGPRMGTHKVSVGKGIKFHTAGLVLRNRNGGRLAVGGIEALVEALSRRVP